MHLAFTGILSRPRREARRAARRAGAVVHGGPSARTTVVVRGRPNPLQAAGRDAGLKLMEIKRLRAKGHRSRCSTSGSSGASPPAASRDRSRGRSGDRRFAWRPARSV